MFQLLFQLCTYHNEYSTNFKSLGNLLANPAYIYIYLLRYGELILNKKARLSPYILLHTCRKRLRDDRRRFWDPITVPIFCRSNWGTGSQENWSVFSFRFSYALLVVSLLGLISVLSRLASLFFLMKNWMFIDHVRAWVLPNSFTLLFEWLNCEGNIWTAVAHIITGVIGSGVLSLAWCMAQLGWIAGPLAMLSFALVTIISASLLSDSYRSPDPEYGPIRHRSYREAVRMNLGKKPTHNCYISHLVENN